MGKRENKKLMFRFVSSRCAIENFKKIAKKFKKFKKNTIMTSFHAKIGQKSLRKGANINYRSVPFRSNPTRNRKFQKKAKKLKNTIMESFQAIIGWKRMRKREDKNYRSVLFKPDA